MTVVCVAAYHTYQEALIAKSKLDFYGIPAWFPEEHLTRFKWIYAQGASLCRIEVPACCADDALFLLNDTQDVEPEDYGPTRTTAFHDALFILMLYMSGGPFYLLWAFEPPLQWFWQKIKSRHRPQSHR